MTNKHRGIVSLLLTLAMLVSMIPTAASAASAEEVDHIIFDFRSESALTDSRMQIFNFTPTAAEPDPDTAGKYEWDAEKQALRILYAESRVQPVYRLMTVLAEANYIPEEYRYMTVVYQAKTTESFDIILSNSMNRGGPLTLVSGGDDTDGEWFVSDIIDINTEKDGGTIRQRWNGAGANNRIHFETSDKKAEFYIKEYALFKSEADAMAYYETADLSKTPVHNTNPGASSPASPSVPALEAPYGQFYETTSQTIEEIMAEVPEDDSGSEATAVEPYVMNLRSWGDMTNSMIMWHYHDGIEEGKQKMVVNSGDDNSCQLLYSQGSKWGSYVGMLKFSTNDVVTKEHRWARLVYRVIDSTAQQITIGNNASGAVMTVVPNTKVSNGNWVVSAPFDLSESGFIDRLVNGKHITVSYTGSNPEAKVFLKEIVLFGSEAQAYEYYGDSAEEMQNFIPYSAITFGKNGNADFLAGPNYGNHTENDDEATLDITYADSTNMTNVRYMAKIKFGDSSYNENNIYTRILYSANNPEGVTDAKFYLRHDASWDTVCVANNVNDTDGEFVLSDVNCLGETMPDRFLAKGHCSLFPNVSVKGGEYRIKAIYFFSTREMAEQFSLDGGSHNITVNGNDITNYQIVVSDDNSNARTAAEALQLRVNELTGYMLPIVSDDTPEKEHEIIIGKNTRVKSTERFDELQAADYRANRAIVHLDGKTVVFVSDIPAADVKLVESFCLSYLYEDAMSIPEIIELGSDMNVDTVIVPFTIYDWGLDTNAEDPEVFEYSFDFDEGYFVEENGEDNFEYYNGEYRTKVGVKTALSYLHVYERDAEFSLDMKYTDISDNAIVGIMTRYNSAEAWVRAGYDFAKGEWFIESCEGKDFYVNRIASVKGEFNADTVYNLSLKVDEQTAELYVNRSKLLESTHATHATPGRVGFFTNGASISVDNAEFTMMSGEGTVWKDVAHTKLPYDDYLEGGSVFEMNDGSLIYQQGETAYKSTDNGITWAEIDAYFMDAGYPNIIRLNNGDWLQIFHENGYVKSRTSSDDGKTWTTDGTVCAGTYPGSAAWAGNMNDKLMVTASGRILYGQNYEGKTAYEGRTVFCEFYFSDDNGKTWYKSETDSWEIGDNESVARFGEAKLLECADGTIRMYNSWGTHGVIVYSDSTDGGKTFGPLQRMEGFPSSQGSMQFVRDTYAENDHTYYMVWVNNPPMGVGSPMPRSRLTLAKTTDGKTWTVLGDVWRWESGYMNGGAHINHIVDPFIKVTKDYLLIGSGLSEHTKYPGEAAVADYHQAQRQHIYSIPKASLEDGENLYKFTDVDTNDSYYDAVKFAVDEGLFNGTSETTFAPDTVINRAMFVTVLGRLDGADVSKYITPTFSDVEAGQWYTSYVEWAAANGIVNGMGNGIYSVDGEVTVEQACTILYRYADGKKAAENSGIAVTDFTDGECVSAWAADGVKWAVENGIYTGVGEALSPTCAAPRWLVATMFANYSKNIK